MHIKSKTLTLTLTAVFTALCTVVTMFVLVPDPATKGYINVGDSIIFLCAVMMGPIPALFVGGIGSMLADLLLGYVAWAPFTLVIKGLEGLICGALAHRLFAKKEGSKFTVFAVVLAMLCSAAEMVTLYFFSGWILQGSAAAAIASIPSNLIQASLSLVIASVIIFGFGINKHARRVLWAKLDHSHLKKAASNSNASNPREQSKSDNKSEQNSTESDNSSALSDKNKPKN